MKKETALKRIRKEVEKVCPNETTGAKTYLTEIVYMFFVELENDIDSKNHTSSENLRYAILVNLYDLYDEMIEEARKVNNI